MGGVTLESAGPDATARARLLAELASRPTTGTLRPPSIAAARPIRALPPALVAKLEARARAGYEIESTRYPSDGVWQRVVTPVTAGIGVDLVVLLIALLTGHHLVAAVTAVVFAA